MLDTTTCWIALKSGMTETIMSSLIRD